MTATEQADGVVVEAADGVLRLRLDRPERRNALDRAAVRRLVAALEAASTDDSLRVVHLSGTGDHFCSGADWVASNTGSFCSGADWVASNTGSAGNTSNAAQAGNAVQAGKGPRPRPRPGSVQRRTALEAHRLIELMTEVQLPVVCEVRGWAAGLGCQLALAADITIAADDSVLWEPFMERGFSPDGGATWLLPRLVGLARAKELLLLGRKVSGREAADWGLVMRSVPSRELAVTTRAVVDQLAGAATVAVGLTKRCIHRSLSATLPDALEAESNALELTSRTADFKEGLAAFRERRPAGFEGR